MDLPKRSQTEHQLHVDTTAGSLHITYHQSKKYFWNDSFDYTLTEPFGDISNSPVLLLGRSAEG